MKRILTVLFVVAIFLQIKVNAQDRGFGLGIILGQPTGVSGKYWTNGQNAFDFAAAWSFSENGNLLLQADYVWHMFRLIQVSEGKLPLYVGVGGEITFANRTRVGVRVPVGLDYLFANAPVDIFLEIVPILELVPETDFDLAGGVGVRYWFN